MNTATLTIEAVKGTEGAKELHKHIKENTSGLVGCQWVVMELIQLESGLVGKIIGSAENNNTVSAPISYFRERHYCGIVYHFEDWCRKKETIESVKQIAAKTGNQLAFYNPYQDRVILIS